MAIDRGLDNLRGQALAALGRIQVELGHLDEAIPRLELALQLTSPTLTADMVTLETNLGCAFAARGDLVRAKELMTKALSRVDDTGWARLAALVHIELAGVELEAGAPDVAAAHLSDAWILLVDGDPRVQSRVVFWRASVSHHQGQLERAGAQYRDDRQARRTLGRLAAIAGALGRHDESAALIDEAMGDLEDVRLQLELELLAAVGRPAEAKEALAAVARPHRTISGPTPQSWSGSIRFAVRLLGGVRD